jgi:hypothetical protein
MNDEIIQPSKREPVLTFNLQIGTERQPTEQSNIDLESLENNAGYVTTDSTGVKIHAEFFRVEVYTEKVLEQQGIENFTNLFSAHINYLIKKLNQDTGLKAGIVEQICLAEEALLGEVIFQVQHEKGLKPDYTGQKDYYHTAAKTISYFDKKGDVKNTIVFNVNFYGVLMVAFAENKPYDEWEVSQQLVYYMLAHECGHALDSTARKDISADSNMSVDEFDLEKWSLHYAPLLFNEYIASVIASSAVTSQLQNDMLVNWHNDSEKLIDNLLRRKFAYDFHFREVMNCFWIVLVQLAKLLAHHREDANFPNIQFMDEFEDEERQNEQLSIVNDLNNLLIGFRENYPQIPDDQAITEILTPIFERLAATYNFYFNNQELNSEDDE